MAKTFNKNREMLKAHQYTTKQAILDTRQALLKTFSGSMATICRDEHPMAGYPVSSVVPFILDDQFRPIVQIASVAEHTLNAMSNPKASIFMRERYDGGDVQTQWRICMIGDLLPVDKDELAAISEKYYAHYPKSRYFDSMHDFYFFRLNVQKYRVIMGFGDIRWVAAYAVFDECPFGTEDKHRMIDHMNKDHADAMKVYLQNADITCDDSEIVMTDISQYGCVIRHQEALHFIAFDEVANDPVAVRKALVALAKPAQ